MRSASRSHRLEVSSIRLEITVPRPRQVRFAMDGLVVHQSGLWLPEHLTTVDGIPCTTADRTCIDLSAVLGWLATLPLAKVRVEPIGLQAVYEQYHPAEAAA